MNDTSRIDIVTVDLSKPLRRENCGTLLATGDEYANRFGAKIVRNGEAVDLTGYTVSGSFIRPDGETVTLDGTAEGSVACVDLDAFCYVSDGAFTLAVKIVGEGYAHTVRMVDGYIRRTDTGSYVATDEMIITLDNMKGLAATMAETNKEAEDLIADLNEVSAEADKAIEEANNVVDKLPYIGENGNWYRWDDEAGAFVDSGSPSRGEQGDKGDTGNPGKAGEDGKSITVQNVSESAVDGGYNVVTFSDGTIVNIKNGKTGKDGTGVTILGSYDSEAALKAAHPTGTAGDSYMVAGDLYVWSASESTWKNVGQIQGPAGEDGYTPVKGKDYFDGEDGYTPQKGVDYFDGEQGPPGADGKTPVKGTDYYTEAEKAELVTEVSSKVKFYATAAIGTTWEGSGPYTQTVAVSGMLASDTPIIDLLPSTDAETAAAELEAWSMIYRIDTAADSITVYASEATTQEITIQILGVR